ncbi:LAMI_0A01882g1_1 [Lachancea mirantina]|uniref:LAMI_0A01882g1_1 n=1 Tax=Lachancea mirantina TaxID=1230905 RepID=A0A1G4IM18_9SACH|nr:LAMI_0A01882g1_1 [Lachancea mirantina]
MFEDVKKRRLINDGGLKVKRKPVSKIFAPFRVIGKVSNAVPFAVGTLGSTFYIVTSVGKTFQMYDAGNLHLLFISEEETESTITVLASHFHYVYAGFSNKVGIYRRGRLEHLIKLVDDDATVTNICAFGHFLCISTASNQVHVYGKKEISDKFATVLHTRFSISSLQGGEIVGLHHLPTYLNKLIVVTKSNLLLYNVRAGKLLFSSNEFADQITTAEPAPVLDVIALGTTSGNFHLFNVRKGRITRTIKTPSRISCLSFRTDGSPHIAVGSTNGDLIFYDLDRKSRIHVLKNIHRENFGGVVKATFLNGQPIIVTSGNDNQLKEYVFDPSLSQADSEVVVQPPRFLRSRGGHSQPPSYISFADDQSHFLLSASKDRSVWTFSLRKDAQSQELSQRLHKKQGGGRIGGSTLKEKFPEVVAMAIENARQGDWENVVTAHNGEAFARTWNSATKRVGRWTLPTSDGGFSKSVAMSACGNFALVGSSNGGIGVYNLQSGIPRKKYRLHTKAVTGIALDGMNRKMVSCGLDCIVGFYDFSQSSFLGKLILSAPITSMVYHRASDLFAMALDDFSVVVVDAVTQRVVRQLWGHTNRITSFDFSPDGRWIVTASLDATMRTWDLPSGGCIDGIKVPAVATNVKFSPNGDLLATTHVSGSGISIWTNRAQFRPVGVRHVEESEFVAIDLPNASTQGGVSALEGALENDDNEAPELFEKYESVAQVNEDLVTLSLGPRSKLNTLINLDIIKQRSKPVEPPKKPEKAPFFLSLSGGAVGDDAVGRERDDSASLLNGTDQMRVDESDAAVFEMQKLKPKDTAFESEFTRFLRLGSEDTDYCKFLSYVVGLSPAKLELEIRSLNSFEPFEEVAWFLEALAQGLSTNRDFELYEAFLNILFRVHGDVIHANSSHQNLKAALEKWNNAHSQKERLDNLTKYCAGVLGFLATA